MYENFRFWVEKRIRRIKIERKTFLNIKKQFHYSENQMIGKKIRSCLWILVKKLNFEVKKIFRVEQIIKKWHVHNTKILIQNNKNFNFLSFRTFLKGKKSVINVEKYLKMWFF